MTDIDAAGVGTTVQDLVYGYDAVALLLELPPASRSSSGTTVVAGSASIGARSVSLLWLERPRACSLRLLGSGARSGLVGTGDLRRLATERQIHLENGHTIIAAGRVESGGIARGNTG